MMELDLVSSVLHIPVISIVRHEFPRESQVRGVSRERGVETCAAGSQDHGVGEGERKGWVTSGGTRGFKTWMLFRDWNAGRRTSVEVE
jgi:hypothetical protein